MVYLIHSEYRHYIGYCAESSLNKRLHRHLAGNGSAVPYAAYGYGYTVQIVRVWRGAGRDFERWLKRQKKHRLFCPKCNPRARSFAYRGRRHTADLETQQRIQAALKHRQTNWKRGKHEQLQGNGQQQESTHHVNTGEEHQ